MYIIKYWVGGKKKRYHASLQESSTLLLVFVFFGLQVRGGLQVICGHARACFFRFYPLFHISLNLRPRSGKMITHMITHMITWRCEWGWGSS